MGKTSYIKSSNARLSGKNNRIVKSSVSLILALMFSFVGLSSVFSTDKQDTANAGIEDWIVCTLFGGEVAEAWQFVMTDDMPFYFESKSFFGGGSDKVDKYWLNNIIELGSGDFKKTNEEILGRPLYEVGVLEQTDEETANTTFNGGNKVNPYDRFGISGLNYTGYIGEWKYYKVNVCQNGDPQDPKAGMFYEERLPPQTPYSARENSIDVRTEQHLKVMGSDLGNAGLNTVANWILNISKFLVAFTLGFINFAFSDITSVIGIDKIIAGDATSDGLFQKLYNGVFIPLIVIIFGLTGLNIMWKGIVKRQYRVALTTVLRSLGMFFAAVIIAANPLFWISIPNNASILVQSILVSTMNHSITSGNGLCATDIGITTVDPFANSPKDPTNIDQQVSYLEGVSKNMRSNIGCSFWQQFLFKPWVQGQFGQEWNTLWAANKIPNWAPDGAEALNNTEKNQKMVGDGSVPLGGETVINNWAIYHLSAQTNAHAPTGKEGEYGKFTSGFSNDLWRVVDLMANYQEKTVQIDLRTGEQTDADGTPLTPPSDSGPPGVDDAGSTVRVHPTTITTQSGNYDGHSGIDFKTPVGTPIIASMDGTVTQKKLLATSYGHHIKVRFVDGSEAVYAHLSQIDVATGQRFSSGDILGKTGNTGNSSGPHLHFEVKVPGGSFGDVANRNYTSSWLSGTAVVDGNATGSTVAVISIPDVTNIPPLDAWNTWVGNDPWERVITAFSAVFVTSVGIIAPLVFAALSAVYSIGISLLMAFAPIMLLLGCWADKGWEVFKGWGELVINTTIKRIIMGLLLVVSVVFTSTAIKFMEDENWWTGILLMAILSVILIKNRKKIIDSVAAVRFASHSMTGVADGVTSRLTRGGKQAVGGLTTVGKVAGLSALGATASGVKVARAGGNTKDVASAIRTGGSAGIRYELRNMSYRNRVLRNAMLTHDSVKNSIGEDTELAKRRCIECSRQVNEFDTVLFDEDNNVLCQECGRDHENQDELREVSLLSFSEEQDLSRLNAERVERNKKTSPYFTDEGRTAGKIIENHGKGTNNVADNTARKAVKDLASYVEDDIYEHKKEKGEGKYPMMPAMPKHLEGYVTNNVLERAWETGNYEVVREIYMLGTIAWAMDNLSKELVEEINEDMRHFESEVRVHMEQREFKLIQSIDETGTVEENSDSERTEK